MTGDTLGESPVWDMARGCLWWVDLRRPAVHRLDADGTVATRALPAPVGALVTAPDAVLLGLPDGWWRLADGAMQRIAAFPDAGPGMRLNDAKCDASGRLWFGAMRDRGIDASGGLYSLAAGVVRCHRRALRIPNAIAISPDAARIAFADTASGLIETAPLLADGPGAWSPLAGSDIAPGRPDGATWDAEGFLWNARYGGGCLARIAPDGRLDRLLPLPVSQPTSCAFGGPGMSRLFVTTARQGLAPAALAAEPLAGALLALDPGVRGLPDHPFATGGTQ